MRAEIETERLVLEALRTEHAALCFDKLRDPELYVYVPQDPPVKVDELIQRYKFILSEAPENELWLNWFGRLKADGAYVCFVQATVRPTDATAMLAYQTFHPFRRQGFAKEACNAVINELIAAGDVRHFRVEMDTLNTASRKLVEALDFQQIGITKQADYFKGRSSDEFVYERHVAS